MADAPTLLHLLLVLGGVALLIPAGRGRVVAGEALLAYGLGWASFVVGAGAGVTLTPASAVSVPASASFLIGSTALLVIGPAGGLAGSVVAWRTGRTWTAAIAAALAVGVLLALMPLAFRVGAVQVLATAALLTVLVVLVFLLGRASRLGTVVRYADRHVFSRWRWHDTLAAPTRADLWWLGMVLVGIMMVVTRSPIDVVVIGALAAAAGTYALGLRLGGGPGFPVLPLLAAALIPYAIVMHGLSGNAWWIGGAGAPHLALTTDVEIQLLPLVAAAAFGLAALWPVHGMVPRGVLAPVGGLVLLRLGVDLLPAGLFVWQPVLSPLALVSVWWGGLTGRVTLLLTGWAFQALVTGLPGARLGAIGLLWVALGLGLLGVVPVRWRSSVSLGLYVLAGVGIVGTLPAMLETQLVYSIAALGGVAVALWRGAET